MNEANLAKDYFPEPPTPTSKALPPGWNRILMILQTWIIASLKRTNSITIFVSLYSFSFVSKFAFNTSHVVTVSS